MSASRNRAMKTGKPRFEAMSMLSNRPEHTLVRIEDLNSSGLAGLSCRNIGLSCRNISCFLALLWPKCDSLAGNLLAAADLWRGSFLGLAPADARMTQCGDPTGIDCGALLAIAMSLLSNRYELIVGLF